MLLQKLEQKCVQLLAPSL
uniref:Uncharacterized protein n=1 Tax=Rhizophora mucronata TaxID=61149 RepID=A0A2P2JNY1_RHIMU